jgi:hemolysin III
MAVDLTTQTTTVAAELARPALRGMFHLAAAVAAALGGVWLLLIADSPAGYVGGAVFASSLMLLYATSATYHTITWRATVRRIMKRLDHSMIFVLIAGTYTPFCLDVSLAWGISLLAVVWSLAGAGALLKIAWPDAPRWLSVTLYISLGWVALAAATEVLDRYAGSPLALLLAGGMLYTVGGLVYAVRRPDPWPRVFGYHEVFHALVVGGSAVHYAAIAIYVI